MKFHRDGALPEAGEIFVFGSNMAGRHGAGAAKVAREKFGMVTGCWAGRWGHCYAIPTKDSTLTTLRLNVIHGFAITFVHYANATPHLEYFVTRVGCGLAGYRDDEIAPMFRDAGENCSFAEEWRPHLT